MNERIKELAVQADNYAYKMNPEEDSYGRPANPRKFQQDRDTKFAELIVQEMLDITDAHTKVFHTDQDKVFIEYIKQSVKQHFGAER